MVEQLDAIKAIHYAFRTDMTLFDNAANASALGNNGLAPTIEHFRFFIEVLEWHAHGEEIAVFPAIEAVAHCVAQAYERDHRGLDAAFDALNGAVSANDILETARAMAAFKFHLNILLAKEDAHLYRLFREGISM